MRDCEKRDGSESHWNWWKYACWLQWVPDESIQVVLCYSNRGKKARLYEQHLDLSARALMQPALWMFYFCRRTNAAKSVTAQTSAIGNSRAAEASVVPTLSIHNLIPIQNCPLQQTLYFPPCLPEYVAHNTLLLKNLELLWIFNRTATLSSCCC